MSPSIIFITMFIRFTSCLVTFLYANTDCLNYFLIAE
nr:MAG TPA_asm: hypothetical protein [Caudoviricetes sp.]